MYRQRYPEPTFMLRRLLCLFGHHRWATSNRLAVIDADSGTKRVLEWLRCQACGAEDVRIAEVALACPEAAKEIDREAHR